MVGKNQELNILAAEVPPEEIQVPAPHKAPQPRVPVTGREVLITVSIENQWGLWLSEVESQAFLLKGLCTNLLGLTPSELQC